MFVINGQQKRDLLEQAAEDGAKSQYPVGQVLDRITVPVDIYCLVE
jgi:6-phosphogluconolactonase